MPHATLPLHMAVEEPQQARHIQPIGLGTSRAPIDLNARGVHDAIRPALRRQIAMEPEAVPAGLVTAHDYCVGRQAESCSGSRDLLAQLFDCARRDLPHPRSLTTPDAKPKFPR